MAIIPKTLKGVSPKFCIVRPLSDHWKAPVNLREEPGYSIAEGPFMLIYDDLVRVYQPETPVILDGIEWVFITFPRAQGWIPLVVQLEELIPNDSIKFVDGGYYFPAEQIERIAEMHMELMEDHADLAALYIEVLRQMKTAAARGNPQSKKILSLPR